MNPIKSEVECCPKFDPSLWDGKRMEWKNKKFIKDHVWTFLYIPINFGAVMTRLMGKVKVANVGVPDWLCLSDSVSPWKMDLYLAVDKDIPGVDSVSMTGAFIAKVFEGEFKDVGKWMKEFGEYTNSKGLSVKKQFMWYTTCPKCAKKYGKNYVVFFGQLAK